MKLTYSYLIKISTLLLCTAFYYSSVSAATDYEHISNSNIGYTVNKVNGSFAIWTAGWQKLLYNYSPTNYWWTSKITFLIDDTVYSFNNESWVFISYISNWTTSKITRQFWDIQITQTLDIVNWESTISPDNIKIWYTIKNTGTWSHTVWSRIMLDTMISGNDSAPFLVNSKQISTETIFSGSNIPDYFQAVDKWNPITLSSQWSLKYLWGVPITKFLLGSRSRLIWTAYDYNPSIWSSNWDSAVAIWYEWITLLPEESKDFWIAYGLSGVDWNYNPPLSFGLSGTKKLFASDDGATYQNSTFDIVSYITNITESSIAHNVKATLIFSWSDISLAEWEESVKTIWDMAYWDAQSGSISLSWKLNVNATPSDVDKEITYSVLLESDDEIDTTNHSNSKTLTRTIVLWSKNETVAVITGWGWGGHIDVGDGLPPPPVNNFVASKTYVLWKKAISLSWNDPIDQELSYIRISRSNDGLLWTDIKTLEKWVQSFIDTDVRQWEKYFYRAISYDRYNYSSSTVIQVVNYSDTTWGEVLSPISWDTIRYYFYPKYAIWWKIPSGSYTKISINWKEIYRDLNTSEHSKNLPKTFIPDSFFDRINFWIDIVDSTWKILFHSNKEYYVSAKWIWELKVESTITDTWIKYNFSNFIFWDKDNSIISKIVVFDASWSIINEYYEMSWVEKIDEFDSIFNKNFKINTTSEITRSFIAYDALWNEVSKKSNVKLYIIPKAIQLISSFTGTNLTLSWFPSSNISPIWYSVSCLNSEGKITNFVENIQEKTLSFFWDKNTTLNCKVIWKTDVENITSNSVIIKNSYGILSDQTEMIKKLSIAKIVNEKINKFTNKETLSDCLVKNTDCKDDKEFQELNDIIKDKWKDIQKVIDKLVSLNVWNITNNPEVNWRRLWAKLFLINWKWIDNINSENITQKDIIISLILVNSLDLTEDEITKVDFEDILKFLIQSETFSTNVKKFFDNEDEIIKLYKQFKGSWKLLEKIKEYIYS